MCGGPRLMKLGFTHARFCFLSSFTYCTIRDSYKVCRLVTIVSRSKLSCLYSKPTH